MRILAILAAVVVARKKLKPKGNFDHDYGESAEESVDYEEGPDDDLVGGPCEESQLGESQGNCVPKGRFTVNRLQIKLHQKFVLGGADECNIYNALELTDYEIVLQSDNSLVINYNLPDTNQSFIGFNIFDFAACEDHIVKSILEGFMDIGSPSYKKVMKAYLLERDYPGTNLISPNRPNFARVSQFNVDSFTGSLAVNLIVEGDDCASFDNLETNPDEVTPNGTVIATETPYSNYETWTRLGLG